MGKFVPLARGTNFPDAGSARPDGASLSGHDDGGATMTTYVDTARPATVAVAGVVGAVLALASVVLPYAAYLRRPDLVSLVAGLCMVGSGLVLLRARAVGPVGWLVTGAGYAWFLPALTVPGHPGLGRALASTALLHVALLVHAVVVVGATRARGRLDRIAVALGYVAGLTAAVGDGFRIALPAAGLGVVVAVLVGGRRLRPTARRLRAAAGLALGLGLVGDAVLRAVAGASVRPESWIAIDHPVEMAAAAVLVALAGTRPTAWDVIDVPTDGLAQLTSTVSVELGAPDLRIALSDGAGGWLHPSGEAWDSRLPDGVTVQDATGAPCAVLEGSLSQPVTPVVENVLRLAAGNARLRRSIVGQVDELEASRRRLLSAADWERASLGAQLRTRVIAPVVAMERELARFPELATAHERATGTRRALDTVSRGVDPVGRTGTLRGALDDVVTTAPCEVVVARCEEPRSQEVARA